MDPPSTLNCWALQALPRVLRVGQQYIRSGLMLGNLSLKHRALPGILVWDSGNTGETCGLGTARTLRCFRDTWWSGTAWMLWVWALQILGVAGRASQGLGTLGILVSWALQRYPAAVHCKGAWRLGTCRLGTRGRRASAPAKNTFK